MHLCRFRKGFSRLRRSRRVHGAMCRVGCAEKTCPDSRFVRGVIKLLVVSCCRDVQGRSRQLRSLWKLLIMGVLVVVIW